MARGHRGGLSGGLIKAARRQDVNYAPDFRDRPESTRVANAGKFLGPLDRYINYPRQGTGEILQSYSTLPWLKAVVGKVSESVADTTWRIYVVRDGNKKVMDKGLAQRMRMGSYGTRKNIINKAQNNQLPANVMLEEVVDHPLLNLLEANNPRMTSKGLFAVTQQHIDLVGEAYWYIETGGHMRVPAMVWPVPPDWIYSLPSKDDPNYSIRTSTSGAYVHIIPETQVIPFVHSDPSYPYGRGVGNAAALGDELRTDEQSAKYVAQFFSNSARPDLLISGEGLGHEDTERLEETWMTKLRGWMNSSKPFFFNKKIEVQEIGKSFKDMQLVELRQFQRDIILQVFGVPPEKFGILSSSNRSTIEASDLFWTKDVTTPRIEFLRNVLQENLVPMYDERIILDYESPVVEDKIHQLAVLTAYPGAFKVNEIRKIAGHAPLPDGEGGDELAKRAGEGAEEEGMEGEGDSKSDSKSSDTPKKDEKKPKKKESK